MWNRADLKYNAKSVLCCLPFIFVVPYISTTFAELYHSRKEDIIASGFATEEEFTL